MNISILTFLLLLMFLLSSCAQTSSNRTEPAKTQQDSLWFTYDAQGQRTRVERGPSPGAPQERQLPSSIVWTANPDSAEQLMLRIDNHIKMLEDGRKAERPQQWGENLLIMRPYYAPELGADLRESTIDTMKLLKIIVEQQSTQINNLDTKIQGMAAEMRNMDAQMKQLSSQLNKLTLPVRR